MTDVVRSPGSPAAVRRPVLPPLRLLGLLVCAVAAGAMARGEAPAAPLILENEHLRVVIDPRVGRVMEFTPRSGPERNRLWVNSPAAREKEAAQAGYQNWGGDKVWVAAQPFWRYALQRIWPPDPAVDGSPAIAAGQRAPRQAWLRFTPSAGFQSQLEREFELDPDRPVLRIRNRVTQVAASPFPAQLWSISQVPLPERVVLDVAADAPPGVPQPVNLNGLRSQVPLGPQPFVDGTVAAGEGWVVLRPRTPGQQKLGTLGRWLAGVWADGVLLQRVEFDPAGEYPEATSLQFYYNDRYGELEVLGAARHLAPGATLETRVTWEWLAGPVPAADDAELVRWLQAAAPAATAGATASAPGP